MSYSVTNTFGTSTSSATDVLDEMDDVRDYINSGIVAGDVQDGSILSQHIYRMESYGFPRDASDGPFLEAAGRSNFLQERTAEYRYGSPKTLDSPWMSWGFLQDRVSIHLNAIPDPQDGNSLRRTPVPGMMARMYCPIGDYMLTANWAYAYQPDQYNAGFPTRPGNPWGQTNVQSGWFVLAYNKVGDGPQDATKLLRTRHYFHSPIDPAYFYEVFVGAASKGDVVNIAEAGVYDFWVELVAVEERGQVSVAQRSLVIEGLKQ